MMMHSDERIVLIRYREPQEWIDGIATQLATLLAYEIEQRGHARMLLSGGTTPAPVYESLASRPLNWNKVETGLVDERWLSPQDPDSNAYLVQHSLLDHAEDVNFVPLVRPGKPIDECVHLANLHAIHAPAPCLVVLGMGGDGHTASLFPGATDLPKAVNNPAPYASLDATGCPGSNSWPLRITLTPAGLSTAGTRLLLLRGKQKLEVLQAALASQDPLLYPIRTAIDLPGSRLRVHWCP